MSRHFFIRFRGAPLLTAVSLLICLPSATQAVPPGVPEPIGEWLFNGDFLDSSGNGNHGTPIGDPEFVETPRGIGIALDGVDDEVDFGNGCVDGDCLFEFSTDELFPRQLIDVSLEAWISIDPDPTENGNHDTNTANRIHNIFGKTGEEYMLTYESAQPETPDLHRVGVAFFASTPALEDPCSSWVRLFMWWLPRARGRESPRKQPPFITTARWGGKVVGTIVSARIRRDI